MNFGTDLKQERERLGLTRAEASAFLKDVSASWIDKAESGVRVPHVWMQAEALRRLRECKSPDRVATQGGVGSAVGAYVETAEGDDAPAIEGQVLDIEAGEAGA